jgi:hypothetical protein
MPVRAVPDGEGDWTQLLYQGVSPLVDDLRIKGSFTPAFVEWAAQAVKQCTARFGLVDVGGKPSQENRFICREADAVIILSSQPDKIQEWLAFAQDLNLKVLAILHSTLDDTTPETWLMREDGVFEGTVVGLDRTSFQGSTTIHALVDRLLHIIPEQKEISHMNTLTIAQLATLIGKAEEDYELPNGRHVHGLNWRPEDLEAVYKALKPFSTLGTPWIIDGPAPQWLVVSLLDALHPCALVLADTKVPGGLVPIGQRKQPASSGRGELAFWMEEKGIYVVLHYASDDPISAEHLPDLVPPAVPMGRPVLLNGRTANWGIAELASCYQHVVPAIYVGQPMGAAGYNYVCAITHSSEHRIGTMVNERDLAV